MIDPVDKAKELVEKFWGLDMKFLEGGVFEADYEVAKRMALVAVDEIIDELDHEDHDSDRWEYWVKVKLEIEKI